MCACLVAQSCLTLCDLMDCSLPAPLSMGFPRQQYWNGLPFASLGDLPKPGIEPRSPEWQADSLPSEQPGKSMEALQSKGTPQHPQNNDPAPDSNSGKDEKLWCKGWEWEKDLWHQMLGGWAWGVGCRTDLAINSMNADNRSCRPGNLGSVPGSERSPGEGNSYPLQYSGLRIPMDRRTWGATAHGIAKQWYTSEWLTLSLRVCECRPQRRWHTQKQLAHLFSPCCPIDNW